MPRPGQTFKVTSSSFLPKAAKALVSTFQRRHIFILPHAANVEYLEPACTSCTSNPSRVMECVIQSLTRQLEPRAAEAMLATVATEASVGHKLFLGRGWPWWSRLSNLHWERHTLRPVHQSGGILIAEQRQSSSEVEAALKLIAP